MTTGRINQIAGVALGKAHCAPVPLLSFFSHVHFRLGRHTEKGDWKRREGKQHAAPSQTGRSPPEPETSDSFASHRLSIGVSVGTLAAVGGIVAAEATVSASKPVREN